MRCSMGIAAKSSKQRSYSQNPPIKGVTAFLPLAGVQPPCAKPWAHRLGADCGRHRETIVRPTRVIICRKNLVRHRDGVETMRGGIILGKS